ncbi:MAG: Flp family type IVb pilin [Alphaproteobacteria bacterium]|nr:Flp family type IVb pilin [Alphaproteobacteria bacterium]
MIETILRPWRRLASYAACRKGSTAIEYGLIAAGIALAVSVGVFFFGATLRDYFNYFADYLSNPG